MYVVVNIAGKQYRVSEGQIVSVDKIEKKPGETFETDQVLLLVNQENVQVGQPLVKGAAVKAVVLEQLKGRKIRVVRFKAKVRYRRARGFRPLLTKLEIKKIAIHG